MTGTSHPRPQHGRPVFAQAALLGVALVLSGAGVAGAVDLALPSPAEVTASSTETLGSYTVPLGPWRATGLPTRTAEGAVNRTAWRIEMQDVTTLELLVPLRDGLTAQGFRILFECDTAACGGFDFRFATDVLPEPQMHVDLGDFRFLAAERMVGGARETICLIVSKSARAGFVQMVRIGPPGGAEPLLTTSSKSPDVAAPLSARPAATVAAAMPDLLAGLDSGAVVLDDLVFDAGSADLGAGTFPSLTALASYMTTHPDARVTIVGHTDATGGLAGNIALSRQRAEAVRARLLRDHGAPADRIAAEGVGFLAPRASNLTDEGRTRNRRVEAMLTSTK